MRSNVKKANKRDVESLHALYNKKHNFGVLSFEAYAEGDEEKDLTNAALFKNMDIVISEKLDEMRAKSSDIYGKCTIDFIARLFEVIGHLSVSRCLKMLEISGVTLYED